MDLKINTHNFVNHLQLVERYIQALSHAIATGIVRPDQVVRVQARLDHIERDIKQRTGTVADSVYGPMLELQALIYLASNRQHLVPACIDELENMPKEYTVRSRVFGEFAESAMSPSTPQHNQSSRSSTPVAPHKPSHNRARHPRRKLAVISVVALLVVGMAGFITLTGRMNPVTLAKQYSLSKSLSSQYQQCTDDLLAKKASIDTSDNKSIATYNQEFAECEAVRNEQNAAADTFHALVRFGTSASSMPPQ